MFHHVQLACPPGAEDASRDFYTGVLGLAEIPKPPALAARGGCWFRGHGIEVHLGVEDDFRPALKAHPAILVEDLDAWAARLRATGHAATPDDDFPGMRRFYSHDVHGNRLEFLQALGQAEVSAPVPLVEPTPAMPAADAAFARDPATARYYDQRAGEYDEWYLGQGQFAERPRPGWNEERDALVELVRGLPTARTLDVACGSGFLTQHLRGCVVGLDQSPAMVALTQARLPHGLAVTGDALDLPFAGGAFDRVLTAHFYGHLPVHERSSFLAQAQQVAGELVVIDSALRPGVQAQQWQDRVLNDGSGHRVYKRYLTGDQLAEEVGGQVLFAGSWFVAVRSLW